MSGYFINESYTSAADDAVYLPIGDDSAFFSPSSVIAMTGAGAEVIRATENVRVILAGSVYATDTAIRGEQAGGSSFTITGSGQVIGTHAFDLAGQMNVVLNGGFVSGQVAFEDGENRLLNTGTISNTAAAVAIHSIDTGSSITNSGTISSVASAISFAAVGIDANAINDLVNSGTIASQTAATIDSSHARLALHVGNSGTIGLGGHGGEAILGSSADDVIVNSGTIIGDLLGFGGDDTIDTSHGTLQGVIYGGLGDDQLIGMATGNNVLDGGAGADLIEGGSGTDTASYVSADAGVTVDMLDMTHNRGDAAGDTFVAIERIRGSGFVDTLGGDNLDNRMSGNDGADLLSGRGGNDVLYGGDDNDILDGGAGNDRLSGQNGIDTATYASATAGVTVSLAITGAQDTIGAGIDTLSSIESLAGSRLADHLTGSVTANRLAGGNGDDVLDGGFGHDTLVGGKGHDSFVFSTAPGSSNIDVIADYVVADDTIDLAKSIFAGFAGLGTISSDAFYVGSAAHDASDRIVYNPITGGLFYDADGNGAGAAIEVATMHTHLALTNADFVVI